MPSAEATALEPAGPPRIPPGDPRYQAVLDKQFNKRFRAQPEYVRLLRSTEDVLRAVQEAVAEGRRFVVTSGGHCLEDFVSQAGVPVILDVSLMKRVYHDEARSAVAVEAGATVGETFEVLFRRWGAVLPLGEYPGIGMGGHVLGGAFGFLCRQLGLAADYLWGVEVVTVDEGGRARVVVATREADDPNHDLWWAHTGGGGGNFGVVTRYWFRAPGAAGGPASLLPRAPDSVTTFSARWGWDGLDRERFVRLLGNAGAWGEANSGSDSPNATLWTLLIAPRRPLGPIVVRGVSTAGAGAQRQVQEYLEVLGAGVGGHARLELLRMPWLDFALNPFPDLFAGPPGGVSAKIKDALLRKRLSDGQAAVAYDYLTREGDDGVGGMIGFASYGGRVNEVPPGATASAGRQACFDMACNAGWVDPGAAARSLAWVRAFYGELFAASGGVPVPGEAYDGAIINHPDADLADPALNSSGVPWSTLYYQGNYPRLQRVKARWDPLDLFRHALAIRPG